MGPIKEGHEGPEFLFLDKESGGSIFWVLRQEGAKDLNSWG